MSILEWNRIQHNVIYDLYHEVKELGTVLRYLGN